jgi:hypothetical protein
MDLGRFTAQVRFYPPRYTRICLRSRAPDACVHPLVSSVGQVEEIINEGVQEGKIENELAKIDAAWRDNALVVVKYKKDGQDRGFMLRAAEDRRTWKGPGAED